MKENLKHFAEIAKEHGLNIMEPILTNQIIFDIRTTYKCRTCDNYTKKPTCPPNIPDINYFEKLINSYGCGIIVGLKNYYKNVDDYNKKRDQSGMRLQNILQVLESEAFQKNYYWAISFIGGSCRGCNSCPTNDNMCVTPSKGRMPMEAIGINVIETCKKIGIEISPFPLPMENGELYRIGLLLLE